MSKLRKKPVEHSWSFAKRGSSQAVCGLDKKGGPVLNAVAHVDFFAVLIVCAFGIIDVSQTANEASKSSLAGTRRVCSMAESEVNLTKTYDAIVIGSGAARGMAAHVLTGHGLQVLLLEAGKELPIEK